MMSQPLDDEQQKEALLNLDRALIGKKPLVVSEYEKREKERLEMEQRRDEMEKKRKVQGTVINDHVNATMSLRVNQTTTDTLAMKLQDDNRYLLNVILNNIEIIKREMREINQSNKEIKDSIEQMEVDNNDYCCCLWPCSQTQSL
jgi:hypothetical protein